MDTTDIRDFLQLHDDFVRRVRQAIEAVRAEPGAGGGGPAAGTGGDLLERFRKRLDAVAAAKQRIVQRLDDETLRLQQTMARLGGVTARGPASPTDDRPAPEGRTDAPPPAAPEKPKRKSGGTR